VFGHVVVVDVADADGVWILSAFWLMARSILDVVVIVPVCLNASF
jgi:hypothetical protein